MFCNQCGTKLNEGVAFCSNCGAPQKKAPAPKPEIERTVGVFNMYADQQPAQPTPAVQVVQSAPAQPEYPTQPTYPTQPVQEPVQQASQPAPVRNEYPVQPSYPSQPAQPEYTQPLPSSSSAQASNGNVGFGEAIKLFFTNYVNFSGKASKSEFWWGYLFMAILCIPVAILSVYVPPIGILCSVGITIPSLSLTVRRIRDTGKPWKYIFMGLIPFAGAVLIIIQCCKNSAETY